MDDEKMPLVDKLILGLFSGILLNAIFVYIFNTRLLWIIEMVLVFGFVGCAAYAIIRDVRSIRNNENI